MAHAFESGFNVGKQSWHGLATVLQSNPTVKEAIKAAGLDWRVEERELLALAAPAPGSTDPVMCRDIKVDGFKALMRSTDGNILGVVTKQYSVLQNDDTFELFDRLVEDGTVRLETAGSLQGGRKVWICARYRDDIEVKGGDAVAPFLLAANSHDGTMSIRLINTPIRVECWNMLQAAGAREDGDSITKAASASGFSIPHVGDVVAKAASARNAIVTMNRELGMTIETYRQWADLPVDDNYVRALAKKLFDPEYLKATELIRKFRERADADRKEETARKIAELEKLLNTEGAVERKVVEAFHESPGAQLAGETKWGAFNAVTYYIDHAKRGEADSRLASSMFGDGASKRRKAFELIAASR